MTIEELDNIIDLYTSPCSAIENELLHLATHMRLILSQWEFTSWDKEDLEAANVVIENASMPYYTERTER